MIFFANRIWFSLTHVLVLLEQIFDKQRIVFEVHFDFDAVEQQVRVVLSLYRLTVYRSFDVDIG